jgi:hypothetical protein
VDKTLDTVLLAFMTTTNSTLPQQGCPAELFFGRKTLTTLDLLLLPTKQPTGRDLKMEQQFNCRQGAVARNFDGDKRVYVRSHRSHEWKAGSVTKRIDGRLYDVTLADGSTRSFHANQMRLKSTKLMEDEFTELAKAFNLPVQRPQVANGETGHLDGHAVDHHQETSN